MGWIMTDILIVEDNKELGNLLCDFLKADGYSVCLVESGEEALRFFEKEYVRLLVLDIMLPGIDGFAVCSKIREQHNTPIIIISAKVGKEDKLTGLILGADDYMEKPYDIDILFAKISGIFKRRYESDVIIDDNLKIEKMRRIAYLNSNELTMTAKEFDLLLLFMENKGKTLKKDWIFNQIWGFDSLSEPQTLTVHMKWLRQKIDGDPQKAKRISTVWGVGYRFE